MKLSIIWGGQNNFDFAVAYCRFGSTGAGIIVTVLFKTGSVNVSVL
jgi:hypothetical protein